LSPGCVTEGACDSGSSPPSLRTKRGGVGHPVLVCGGRFGRVIARILCTERFWQNSLGNRGMHRMRMKKGGRTKVNNSDVVTYCNCMAEIRRRIALVQAVVGASLTTGQNDFDIEIVFLQLRKVLELIALGSLTANKKEYSAAYEKFASHWNAERVLRDVAKINRSFFPVPLDPPQIMPNGVKHFSQPPDGFLTKDEFALLYDKCGKILHARNPFSAESPTVQIGYSVAQWVSRIQKLLGLHLVNLVNGDIWVVQIPNEGNVMAFPASEVSTG